MLVNKKILLFFVLFISLGFSLNYFENRENIAKDKKNINFSSDMDSNVNKNSKNQFIAMGLSAIVPGTGQIYNGDWKRGVGYLGMEILLWTYRKKYNDKGDKYVDLYENYAREHWSFENWIKNYYAFIDPMDPVYEAMINPGNPNNNNDNGCNGDSGINDYCHPWSQAHYIGWYDSNGFHRTDSRDYIEDIFSNQCSDYYDVQNGCSDPSNIDSDYFENVSVNRDHHFHEGIGKYNLYFAGWDDVNECIDSQGQLITSPDCRWIENKNGYNVALSSRKQYYQDYLRAKSNDKYDHAENALTAIFINHAISMFDALISSVLKKNKDGLNFHSEPIYNFNYNGKIEGLKVSLEW